jgi:hypothetical protein
MPGTNKVAVVDVNPYGTHGITPCFVGVCIFYFLSLFLYCCFVSSPSLYSEIVSYLATFRLFYILTSRHPFSFTHLSSATQTVIISGNRLPHLYQYLTHYKNNIQLNKPMWSPLLSQTCPCGHLY